MGVSGQRHASAALLPGKRVGTHCTGGWVGQWATVGKNSPLPVFDPRTFQPVASRCTDWAIPVHYIYIYFIYLFKCIMYHHQQQQEVISRFRAFPVFMGISPSFLWSTYVSCIHALLEGRTYPSLSNIPSTWSQWSITSDISTSNTILSTFCKTKPGSRSPKASLL